LEQQLYEEASQPVASRRGRRSSRTGTTSLDAQAEVKQPDAQNSTTVDFGADESAKGRRGRKPSRRPSSILSDPVAEDKADLVAAEHPSSTMVEAAARRGRTSSRRSTSTVSNPLEFPEPQALELQTVGEVQQVNLTAETISANPQQEATPSKRGRRTSRKTVAVDAAPDSAPYEAATAANAQPPVDAAAAVEPLGSSAEQTTKRGRRASRRSSVIEPSTADGAAAPSMLPSQGETHVAWHVQGCCQQRVSGSSQCDLCFELSLMVDSWHATLLLAANLLKAYVCWCARRDGAWYNRVITCNTKCQALQPQDWCCGCCRVNCW